MKKILSVFAAIALIACFIFALPACKSTKDVVLLDENIVDDSYDNYYEIFVYSFCDSDGNGVGDLNGVTSKLDYIREMGYTGIWLMPIMPTPSYHGYDVTDYYSINSKYGTMEDYENLLNEAHERGIKVIIDLVVNHSSSQHTWFNQAVSALKTGNTSNKYYEYYNFVKSSNQPNGYCSVSGANGWWYEAWFDSGMPDLNLDSTYVREEIENMMKFWLEKGTDGFRLDACKYFYYGHASEEGQPDAGVEFCKWLKETACKYNPNAYLVGEDWEGASRIKQFYTSGMDSFFCFPTASTDGSVTLSVRTSSASYFWSTINTVNDIAGDGIPAPFLSNHDNGIARIAGVMSKDAEKIKFAYGLACMYNGNVFTYYGDEIGMTCVNATNDPDLRVGILWKDSDKGNTIVPPGASGTPEYLFGSVESQLKDPDSILNYYKQCNNARNAFPSLMRGTPELISYNSNGDSVLAFTKTWKDEKITIVINLGTTSATVNGIQGELAQSLCVTGSVKQSSDSLTMPKYSIAILK